MWQRRNSPHQALLGVRIRRAAWMSAAVPGLAEMRQTGRYKFNQSDQGAMIPLAPKPFATHGVTSLIWHNN
jgi:hypothetical protein